MTFINFSNHPSASWGSRQMQEAVTYGEVKDLAFPAVPAHATEEEIRKMADDYVEKIMKNCPSCVLCMGEFSLAFAVVKELQKRKILCLCTCSDRTIKEMIRDDGKVTKVSEFAFAGFRRYL